jgi:hypothetical protein
MFHHQEWMVKVDLILGRSSEILRDEVKFSKFVSRLRKRFSNMFNDMLKTQLILKNIITPEDWDIMVSIFNMTSYMIIILQNLKMQNF